MDNWHIFFIVVLQLLLARFFYMMGYMRGMDDGSNIAMNAIRSLSDGCSNSKEKKE